MKELQRRKRVSIDDERDYTKFSIGAFKDDFVDNAETTNNISSVLSAMITQIDRDNNWDQERPTASMIGEQVIESDRMDNTTAADSLDDLFRQFQEDVSCDLRLKSRGPDPVPSKSLAETLDSRHNKGIKIHEENDKTLEVQQTIPLAMLTDEKERLEKISEREKRVLDNLCLPG